MNDQQTYQDIRVFRFRAPLLKRQVGDFDLQTVEFRADGPVPICNDNGKIIGFASITDQKQFGMANCAIDPSNPERLDLELGAHPYWLDMVLELRGFTLTVGVPTVAHVRGLRLTTTEIYGYEQLDITGSLM